MNQVSHWTPVRWISPARSVPTASRAEVMYTLIQHLADLAAEAEHRPSRPVPRLDNDLSLPDQFRVMIADLLLAAPAPTTLAATATKIESTRL